MSANTPDKRVRKGAQLTPINSIVYQNILQIRQHLIDERWAERVLLKDEADGIVRKPASRRNKAERDAFQFRVAEVVNEELGQGSFQAGGRLPDSPAFRPQIVQALGIDSDRLRAIEEGMAQITVEEMMKFAYLGNVDVAHMLTPHIDVLLFDEAFELQYPFQPKTSVVDWVLWISNLSPLPERDSADYLSNTAVPIKRYEKVDGRNRRVGGEPDDELRERVRSGLSSGSALRATDPDAKKAYKDYERFNFPVASGFRVPSNRAEKISAIRSVLFVRTRLRTITQLTRAKHNDRKLHDLFVARIEFLGRDFRELLNLFRG